MKILISIFLLCVGLLLFSCRTSCPLPSCEIRKAHRHALNFKNTKEYEKEQRQIEEDKREKEELFAKEESDSLRSREVKLKELEDLDPEHDLALQKEQGIRKKEKKERKRKKEKDSKKSDVLSSEQAIDEGSINGFSSEQELDEFDDIADEEDILLANVELDTKEAKKELKEQEKLTKFQEKEAQKAAKKERAEIKESDKVYSGKGGDSKLWWKRKRYPEVGEDYEEPEREEKNKINEYVW